MSLKRRAIGGIVISGLLVTMSTVAASADQVAAEAAAVSTKAEARTDLATGRTAGVVVPLDQMQTAALTDMEEAAVEVEHTTTQLVAAAETPEPEVPAMPEPVAEPVSEEELAWQNRLMADVQEFLYVRASGDENSEIVGKLYRGAVADIVERGDVWTHIVSGNVDGYVMNSYCLFGTDAMNYAAANFDMEADIQANGLRIRRDASTDGSVIAAVSTGTTLTVDTEAAAVDGWVAVSYGGETGYVSAEYVTTEMALGEAITIEEEQAAIARAEEEKAAAAASQVQSQGTVQNQSVAASVDDVTLLAALIQCEAGNEPYEGQLAVGAVVMNRVRSGRYPGSIYEVIYQAGQFPPAGKGYVANKISNGVKSSCLQAAQEAINGMDNTGGAMSFRRASSGHPGVVIGNHVFY